MTKQGLFIQGGVEALPGQTILLDFDGELTSYDGEILTVDAVEVENSGLTRGRIETIVARLNAEFASQYVRFTADPAEARAAGEYSTIYIGKTSAFAPYGHFAGLAETVDRGNVNRTDKAFVMLDAFSSDEAIVATIAHEAGHLLGTLDHGGKGLAAYADQAVPAGTIVTGETVTAEVMNVSGTANSIYLNVGGSMLIFNGGTASTTTIGNSGVMTVLDGGHAEKTIINSGGRAAVSSGGVISGTTIYSAGAENVSSGGLDIAAVVSAVARLAVSAGGTASATTVESGGSLTVSSGGTAQLPKANPWGFIGVLSGGTATGINAAEGAALGITVASNTYIAGTSAGTPFSMTKSSPADYFLKDYTVNNKGWVSVDSGASTTNITVADNGRMIVNSAGTATSTTVGALGDMSVEQQGVADSVTVSTGGKLNIKGNAANAVVAGGSVSILDNGVAVSTTVGPGGSLGVGYSSGSNRDGGLVQGNIVTVGTASNTIVEAGGVMVVSAGECSSYWTPGTSDSWVESTFSQGGSADLTTVKAGGFMAVSSGGMATNITAEKGAALGITVAQNTYIAGSSAGSEFVMTDGVISGFTITDGSWIHVERYTQTWIALKEANIVHWDVGGEESTPRASDVTVGVNGDLRIYGGGQAHGTVISSGGSMTVSGLAPTEEATNHWVMWSSAGTHYLGSHLGGFAENTTVNSSGTFVVSGGGERWLQYSSTIAGMVADSTAGSAYVGGTANSTTVNAEGHMIVSSGGTAANTTVNAGGTMTISEGGFAGAFGREVRGDSSTSGAYKSDLPHSTTLYGSMVISSGGSATRTVVSSGGTLFIYGGKAQNTAMRGEGLAAVYDKGSATGNVINEWAHFAVYSGGTANANTINSQGSLTVFGGGRAMGNTVNSGGTLFISSGGTANTVSAVSGGSVAVSSGGNANTVSAVDGGRVTISASGTVNSISLLKNNVLAASGGFLSVEGGTANNVTIGSDTSDTAGAGSMTVFSGKVSGVTVWSKGSVTVSGGTVSAAAINAAASMTVSGGTAAAAVVGVDGEVFVEDGASALDTVENGGFVELAESATGTFAANSFTGAVISRRATIHSGTTALDLTVDLGGRVWLYDGGLMSKSEAGSGTIVEKGGVLTVYGGSANNVRVNSSGVVSVFGGTINIANFDGLLAVFSGGSASSIDVNPGGSMTVNSGGSATDVREFGGYVGLDDEDAATFVANSFTIASGLSTWATVHSGTTAYDNTVKNEGQILVHKGGLASETRVDAGGSMTVFEGGVAEIVTVYSGSGGLAVSGGSVAGATLFGSMTVFNGEANSTVVSSGGSMVISNGTATGTTVESAGSMVVSGGTAGNTVLAANGSVTIAGGTAENTTIDGNGAMTVSGGTAENTTISGNGTMTVSGGGTAENTVLAASGSVTIASGGSHRGSLEIAEGATFSANAGAVIDFTLAGRNAEDGALVNDLARITGTASYSITVAAAQTENFYTLAAAGASGFAATLTLGTDEDDYGTISVGNSLAYGDYTFTLMTEDTSLILKVDDGIAPEVISVTPDVTEPTNQDVTVTATFNGTTRQKQYSLDGSTWSTYTDESIAMTDNGTVYFRGIDAVGNISVAASYEVTNIDKIPPVPPTAAADITAATNQDVTVTATFSEDSTVREFSLDGETWSAYTQGIVMEENGTVYFRGIDAVGNVSDVTPYAVTNIDKVPPVPPTAAADITAATNQDVTVTAAFSDDSTVREYSLDGETWSAYTQGIVMEENGTVYFRATDAVGNVSQVTGYAVTNIDKIPPVQPTAVPFVTEPTYQNVTVGAVFSDDSAQRQYSLDGANWTAYTQPVVMTDNGMVYFRGIDAVGNVSEVTAYAVTNIDRTPPDQPFVSADITSFTNRDVTLTAFFSDDSVRRQYSPDGANWADYTQPVVMTENGVMYFRAIDTVGNFSMTGYAVGNIDKTPPAAPTQLRSTVTGNQAVIDWEDVADNGLAPLAGYEISYGNSPDLSGTGRRVGGSIATLSDLSRGMWYCSVRTLDAAGNASEWSNLQIFRILTNSGGGNGGQSDGKGSGTVTCDAQGNIIVCDTGTARNIGQLDPARWQVLDSADYDKDGVSNLLVQDLGTGIVRITGNVDGGIDGGAAEQGTVLGVVSGGYSVAGAGNFNGSEFPGALLLAPEQVSPGYSKVTGLACWTLDNAFNMAPGWLGAMVTTWDGEGFKMDPADLTGATDAAINAKYYRFELAGVGDFNGDGVDDVMIRNNMPQTAEGRTITGSGDVFVFLTGVDISGYQAVNVAYTGRAADPWQIAGIGDFNGDEIDDVLLKNTSSGEIATWLLDSTAKYVSVGGIGTLSAGQNLAGVGDVDDDGIDDVLFTDVDGSLKAWTVNNGAPKGLIALG